MAIDYLDIGQRIRKNRISKGLTQEKLSELVGIGASHMSHLESGKTVPREAQKRRIAELRDMGKRELKILCQAKGVKLNKSADE